MARRRLGGRDHRVAAHRGRQGPGLRDIALRCPGGVGVDVADVAAGEAGVPQRLLDGADLAPGIRQRDVVGVGCDAGPARAACTRAPRDRANSARSSTTMPAPSDITKPSLPRSKGREARSGASLRSDRARICAKVPIESGGSGARCVQLQGGGGILIWIHSLRLTG